MVIADRLSALTPEQRALFEKLRQEKRQQAPAARAPQPPPIPDRGAGEHWPLSFDQERLWFLYTLDPEDTAYNIDTASRIRGPLDHAVLEQAFQEIPRRHEIWRTAFPAVAGRPVQAVLPEMRLPSLTVDLRALPQELREPTAHRLMVASTRLPFALETGPLVRALSLRLADEECIVHLVVHHIVTDWVTFQLFWREIGLLYEALVAGRPSSLPAPPRQFADYAVWQRDWMRGEVEQYFLRFWVERLRGAPLTLDLPADRPRPPVVTNRGGRVPVRVERAAELKALARREGLTPFMAVLTAYQLVLARWSGADQVIVGSPNANRNRIEIQEMFGFLLTQLPFCTDFAGNPTLREALRRTRDVALAAYAHQDLPFGKLVEALQPERDLSRAPIIQVVLLLLDGAVLSPRLADLDLEPVDVHDGSSRFDTTFGLWDHPALMHGWYEYNTDLWDRSSVVRLVDGFQRILDEVLADPERRLSEVVWASPEEIRQALAGPVPQEMSVRSSLPRLFEAQVDRSPDAPAVSLGDHHLTYRELGARASHLARHLRAAGVRPGDRVALRLDRSLEQVVSLLAVLKTGAAYVPLDPAWPAERLAFACEDSGASLLLDEALLERWAADPTDPTDPTDRSDAISPDLPAYVIYTSGSTGRPKGVVVPHGAVTRLFSATAPWFGFGPGDVWTLFHSWAFDFSVWEIWGALLHGGRLVVVPWEVSRDPEAFLRLLEEERVTVLNQTPSAFRQLAPRPLSLRWIIFGGEALDPTMLGNWFEQPSPARLVNMYGITETTVHVTFRLLTSADAARPASLIGRPIPDLTVHVLDRHLGLQPDGVPGEICVGGAGLAQGYLSRPELTAARFVPDPWGPSGARLYRSGDLARRWPDGDLEYLGRIDHQVKIRGVRIELGEVEAALAGHPSVEACVVVARDGELVAWVVGRNGTDPSPDELRRALRTRLPEAMIPSAFVALAALPLTANGKVDRRALPAPTRSRAAAGTAYASPRTQDEELLAGLWEKVLGIERAGRHDQFFDAGGHSLLATRLTLQIRDAFGVDLSVRSIFQAPTIAEQAELIAALRAGGATVESRPIRRLPRTAWPLRAPLSFAQERLWFIDRLIPGSPAYNLPVALRLEGRLDAGALATAFHRLVERHEALRTALPEREGRPVQEVLEVGAFQLRQLDLSGAANPDAEARRLAEADALQPFDLAAGPLLRVHLLHLGPERHVLLLAMHHIVSDAWSMGVLVEDLTALYAGRALPELPVQYADYAVWQRERLTGEEVDRQLAFWQGELAGAPRVLDLPADRPRPPVQSLRGGMLPLAIDAGTSAALSALARRAGASLYMVLLAGWSTLLARLAGQPDLVVGTTVANRDRPEVESLIGFFVNTLALRIDATGDPAFTDLLGRLRHRVLDAFAHRDLPFEKLVEELHPVRDRSRQPLFQVMLTFQNVPAGRTDPGDLGDLRLIPLEVEAQTAKFDLTLTLFEEGDRIAGRLEYAGDLYDRATVERWIGAFGRLLAGAAAAPEDRISDLPLLGSAERHHLLAVWNRETPLATERKSLPRLFQEQVERTPDAPAVSDGDRRLTYRELDEAASRLARHLRIAGVRPGDRVALCLERSIEQVAAVLAVLATGAAYVPLDPAWPAERIAFAQEDSGASLLIDAALLEQWQLDPTDPADRSDAIDPEQPAYVIYTSGSTGRPKGVVVPHGAVARLFAATAPWFGFGPGDVWTLFHSYAFDFSVWEIWGALLHGGRLVIVPSATTRDPEAFLRLLEEERVTVLNQTPSAFRQLAPRPLFLRFIIFGGEALDPVMLGPWFEQPSSTHFVNMYGITETTVHVTFRPLAREDFARPASLIGQPIPDLTVHVLDRQLGLVPVGVPGEICVGGAGLAQGYLNRPELTAERFVPDPFGPPGARLYRSGDLARRRPDGDLEYLGRIDAQVKIRGFRIEPGEIEAALAAHPAVRGAVVLPREAPEGKTLAAFVALGQPAFGQLALGQPESVAADLQRFLRERLPEPMIPSAWVILDNLPLTPNGKVDRRALAALEVEAARASVDYAAPRTPLESRLVETVAGVLGLAPERVGIHDNFFDLGGHSLLATQLVTQLRLRHQIELPLQLLFDSVDLAGLADCLTERELDEADDALLEELLAELEGAE
jgi:amino acid adenylation domain-containing protein